LQCGCKNTLNSMFKKGTKLYSILTGTCPKCHGESMYVNKNPYILTETLLMHERCHICDTKYKIEPSFFFGAMYVSYAVGIAFAVAAFVITFFILRTDLDVVFISIVSTLIVFFPIILRISRNIWINFFIHYDKSFKKSKN
jgi:uncharacterized protein (DUF983 family)